MVKDVLNEEKLLNDIGIHYKDLFENANDAIFIADAKTGDILIANKSAEKLLEKTREEIMKLHQSDLHPPKKKDFYKKQFKKDVDEKTAIYFESEIITSSGKIVPVSISARLIDTGKRKLMQGIFRDISELIKAQEKIKKLNNQLQSKNESLNNKIKRIDIFRIPLTPKEKLGLYGLVAYPTLTDEELSNKLNFSRTTITAIKNRLRKEGYFEKIIVPNLAFLGCTLLTFVEVSLSKDLSTVVGNSNQKIIDNCKLLPELVFCISKNKMGFGVFASKNLAEFNNAFNELELRFEQVGITFEDKKIIHAPFENFKVISSFNFADSIKYIFKLDDVPELEKIQEERPVFRQLSKKEVLVLYAFTKYPACTDKELAEKAGVSRITVSKMQKRFMSQGIIKVVNYPNLAKLGCEILSLFNVKTKNTDNTNLDFGKKSRSLLEMNGQREIVYMNIFKNFSESKEVYHELLAYLNKNDLALEKPHITQIPLIDSCFSKFNLHLLIKKLNRIELDI